MLSCVRSVAAGALCAALVAALALDAPGPALAQDKEAVAKANPQLRGGLQVVDVAAGSVAATAGIQKGDVLVGLHLWETLNIDNVAFVLNHKDLATFLPLKYFVARDGKLKDGWITGAP
mgnify:CR=1 FL=1